MCRARRETAEVIRKVTGLCDPLNRPQKVWRRHATDNKQCRREHWHKVRVARQLAGCLGQGYFLPRCKRTVCGYATLFLYTPVCIRIHVWVQNGAEKHVGTPKHWVRVQCIQLCARMPRCARDYTQTCTRTIMCIRAHMRAQALIFDSFCMCAHLQLCRCANILASTISVAAASKCIRSHVCVC